MAESVNLSILLEDVLLDRVSLATPYPGKPDPKTGKTPEPKYHVDAILGPNHPQLEQVKELMRAAIVLKFAADAPAVSIQIVGNNKLCLHQGDVDRAGKQHYAGKLFISANNSDQPTVVVTEGGVNLATRGVPPEYLLTPAHPKYPYAGCYANVSLSFNAYNFNGVKGVSAYVNGVQFLRHGVKLRGSSVSAASEFKIIPEAADGPPPPASGGAGLL
jgi:hypothetical protein